MPPVFTEFLYRAVPHGESAGGFNVVTIAINSTMARFRLEEEYPGHHFYLLRQGYCEACE